MALGEVSGGRRGSRPAGSPPASRADHAVATRRLTTLLVVAVGVSVVHYLDNYLNYDEFPTGDALPAPSATVVGVSWFVFTAGGLLGYALYRQGHRVKLACGLLAYYSLSGLVGFGHYAAAGMVEAPWWRQAHVVADIACGIAVLVLAAVSWRRFGSSSAASGSS